MDPLSIKGFESQPTKDVSSIATRSTESLKSFLDIGFQSNHSRKSILPDQTLEEQFESCVSLCKKELEEALEWAKISPYAKTCFHPIARRIDDELLRLEIWALDFGTQDGLWRDFLAIVTASGTVGDHLRGIFDNLNASLETIRMEMKLIQFIVKDAASNRHFLNGKSKMRFDEVGSQVLRVSRANRRVNMSIRIFSSAVRTFISQRSLTSLAEAIECEKDPYDGLLNQSDDTIDKTHKKSQKLIGTSHDEQNEKKMSFSMGIGNLNIIQPKAEGHIRPSAIKTASWGDFYRRPSNSKDNTAREWKSYNLLSLDEGGICSYWSLLALERLMELIAAEEEIFERKKEEGVNENISEEQDGKTAVRHSFWPQPWPDNVSQVPPGRNLRTKKEEANNPEAQWRLLPPAQRYLPCHYFDYVGGSGTGALIAIMLGRFRMTVPDCILEYAIFAAKTFGRPRYLAGHRSPINRPKYNATDFKKVVEDLTKRRGEQITVGQRRKSFPSKRGLCKTFVISHNYNMLAQFSLYLIRSYDCFERAAPQILSPGAPILPGESMMAGIRQETFTSDVPKIKLDSKVNYGPAQDFEIWEAARAATAPVFFDPLKIEVADLGEHLSLTGAGFGYDRNPTKEGANEIERMYGTESIGIVVSIGTPRGYKKRSEMKRMMKSTAQKAGDTDLVHSIMNTKSSKDGFPYYRLNDLNSLDVQLDAWEPKFSRFHGQDSGSKTLQKIRASFDDWFINSDNMMELRLCARELVRCRKNRSANHAKWDHYATGAEFTCRVIGCSRENFDDREEFQQHLERDHDIYDIQKELIECRRDWRYQEARQPA